MKFMAAVTATAGTSLAHAFVSLHGYHAAMVWVLVVSALGVVISGWALRPRGSRRASAAAVGARWATVLMSGLALFSGLATNVDLAMPHEAGNAVHQVLAGLYAVGAVLAVSAAVSLMLEADRVST